MAPRYERSLRPLTVLLVEDNPDDVRLLRRALEKDRIKDVTLVHERRLFDGLTRLAAGGIDAVLLDLMLADSFGLETVRRVRGAVPDVPIVVLTGLADAASGLNALHEGAQDYLVKGQVDGRILDRALRYAIERHLYQVQGALLSREQAARFAAEEALHARDEFLSVAAHELYTPITALELSAQSILEHLHAESATERTGSSLDRKVEIVERQAKRLVRLVESLLEVSRIHVGRFDLVLDEVDLAKAVADVAAALESERARSGSILRLHGERSLVGRWDRSRLEQIVTNLLSNAIKYGEGRPIDVTLGTDGAMARFTVQDHGIGIAPEMQRRIFERFERAVPSRQYGGLGLGLYVVQHLAQAHGGSIRVSSELGGGSTFTIELPLQGPAAEAPVYLWEPSPGYVSRGH